MLRRARLGRRRARSTAEIPDHLRFKGVLDIPGPIHSERALRKHVQGLLDKNTVCVEYLNFCGAGCWQHHVPSIVDEVINRAEFAHRLLRRRLHRPRQVPHTLRVQQPCSASCSTSTPSPTPSTTGATCAGRSFRMARASPAATRCSCRRTSAPMRLMEIRTLCQPESMAQQHEDPLLRVGPRDRLGRPRRPEGQARRVVRRRLLREPGYLGTIEASCAEIVGLAHEQGALAINGVDPITLGVLTPPGALRRRHRLRRHPAARHAHARRRRLLRVHRLPRRRSRVRPGVPARALHRARDRRRPGQYAVAEAMAERTSYGPRDQGNDWVGTGARPVDDRGRRLHGRHGPAGLQGARRDLHHALALRRQAARPSCPAWRSSSRRASSRSSSSTSTAPARPWPRSTRPCSATASSAARTSRADFPELGQSMLLLRDRVPRPGGHRPAGRGVEEVTS